MPIIHHRIGSGGASAPATPDGFAGRRSTRSFGRRDASSTTAPPAASAEHRHELAASIAAASWRTPATASTDAIADEMGAPSCSSKPSEPVASAMRRSRYVAATNLILLYRPSGRGRLSTAVSRSFCNVTSRPPTTRSTQPSCPSPVRNRTTACVA